MRLPCCVGARKYNSLPFPPPAWRGTLRDQPFFSGCRNPLDPNGGHPATVETYAMKRGLPSGLGANCA